MCSNGSQKTSGASCKGLGACKPFLRRPLARRRSRKAAVAQAMRAITIDLEYIDYEIHELLIDGDRAAVHRTVTARNRGAGHPVTGGLWSYFRFRDGLIVEYAEYADSLGLAQLMGHVT